MKSVNSVWIRMALGLAVVFTLAVAGLAWARTADEGPEPRPDNDGYLPAGDGSHSDFSATMSYFHVAGTTLRPRDGGVDWTYEGGGCVSSSDEGQVFNINLDIPQGSRVDYLRLYYYDASENNSTAFLTSYNGLGGFTDLTSVLSDGNGGYGTRVSGLISQTLDFLGNSYVLNWRPNQAGDTMRLCGLRLAYRLPNEPLYLPLLVND